MISKLPLVSVLLPVRNGMPWLEQALASLSLQSLRAIEIIVLEDGSTDGTAAFLADWPDRRMRVIPTGGVGIAAALNVGLQAARAPLVARQDADDVSMPRRLEVQRLFLEQHAQIDVVACEAEYVDGDGMRVDNERIRTIRRQQDLARTPSQIRELMPLTCCITHGSVMMRTWVLRAAGGYRPEAVPAEDYDLWLRLLPHTRFVKLPERLYQYRVHADQSSTAAKTRQIERTLAVKLRYLRQTCPELRPGARLGLVGHERGIGHYLTAAPRCGFEPIVTTVEGQGWDVLAVTDFEALEQYSAALLRQDPGLLRIGNFFVRRELAHKAA
jgi:glycosyltransferase involved in cell wall biosynthesis